jgi:hypothetical protein
LWDLAGQVGTADAVDGGADAVDLVPAGPTVDPAAIVADLDAAPAGIDGGDEVQVRGSGDPGENDVTYLDRRRNRRATVTG